MNSQNNSQAISADKREQARLKELRRLEILDTPPEREFERICELAARTLHASIAAIVLVDETRAWFKAHSGIELREVSRPISFCLHACASEETLIVKDASCDKRFKNNPQVTAEPFIRFYAGAPLITASGAILGSLSVVDSKARPQGLTPEEEATLKSLADLAVDIFERRLHSQQLERAHQQLRLFDRILDSVGDAVLVTDADPLDEPGPRIKYVNRAFERMTGWSSADVIGKSPRLLQGPKSSRVELDRVRDCLGRGEPVRAELINYRKDGSEFWLQMDISPLADERGEHTQFVSVQRDISGERESQRVSQQLTQRLKQILESTTDSVLLLDRDWTIRYLNKRAAAQISGGRDLLGQNVWEAFPAEAGGGFDRTCRQAMSDQKPATLEAYYETLNMWVEVHVFPSRDNLIIFFRDVSERHRVETALRESAERLWAAGEKMQRMLDYSLDMFCVTDAEGRFLELSQASRTILGYDPQELIGRDPLELTHPEDKERTLAERNRVAAGISTRSFENRLRRCDGQYVHILWSAVWLEHDHQTFSVARDITKRAQAQLALRESEENLRFVLESAALGYWDYDFSTDQTSRSVQHDRLFGRSEMPASFTSEDFLASIHPDDRQRVKHGIAHAGRRSPTHVMEFRVIWPDSSVHWLWSAGQFYRKPDGTLSRASGVVSDITERKLAEAELEASEQRYRLLFESSPQPTWVYDRQTLAFLAVNEAAILTYLYSREEFLSMSIRDIRPPEELEKLDRELAKPVQVLNDMDVWRHRTKDGRIRSVEIRSHPLIFEGREAKLVVVTDVTERIRLEERLLQVQKMEALGQLSGGIAHDFNNLLTIINGYASILDRQPEPDQDRQRAVKHILDAGQRAAAMTNQLLTFSRRQVLQPELVRLNRAIAGIEPLLRRLITEDVEIQIRMAEGLGAVKVDPVQIEQVILNLAINARDAMPQGGRLMIETANVESSASGDLGIAGLPPGPYVRLRVSDSGHGMSREVCSRIFEPFFTTKEKGRGTGLGLSTVYGIIKQSGGQISVESEENKGTTFSAYLPRAGEISGTGRQAEGIEPMSLRGTETVLVVEDDEGVRQFTVTVLRDLGYNVMEAQDGPEAIVAVEGYKTPIHLMVTDVVMPRMNGRDLADFLAPKRPAMKVLFVSGYAENVAFGQGPLSPGLSFLSKPFTSEALAQKVRKVLDEPIPNKRVLVIDDEPSVRDLFRHALESGSYDVLTAANGNSAIGQLRDTPVDLVVTDLVMPEKEGLETVQELRRDFPHIKILAVSGAGGGQYLRIAKILGADHVMQKPVSPSDLLTKVKELVG